MHAFGIVVTIVAAATLIYVTICEMDNRGGNGAKEKCKGGMCNSDSPATWQYHKDYAQLFLRDNPTNVKTPVWKPAAATTWQTRALQTSSAAKLGMLKGFALGMLVCGVACTFGGMKTHEATGAKSSV